MTRTGDSYETNQWLDNVLVSHDGYLSRAARLYADGRDLGGPELSPIYGDLGGLPPAILLTGTRDLFLSNTVRTHRKLREAQVEAALHVFEGMSHAADLVRFHADAAYVWDTCATAIETLFKASGASVTRTACGEIARFFDRRLA